MEEIVNSIFKSNNWGEFLVTSSYYAIANNGSQKTLYNIKFLDSKNEYSNKTKRDILTGCVEDSLKRDFDFENTIWSQNCGDSLKIIRRLSKEECKSLNKKDWDIYEVEFLKYPYKRLAARKEIKNGQVDNPQIEQKEFIEKLWPQNCGDALRIIRKTDEKIGTNSLYLCQFIKFPNLLPIKALKNQILKGVVRNYFFPDRFGFYLGGSNLQKKYKNIYKCWDGIKNRCYNKENPAYRIYGNVGVEVEESWKCFDNFLKWYLDNSKWNCITNYTLELDKDIIYNTKKLKVKKYSSKTCLLIPLELNSWLSNDNFLTGVCYRRNLYNIKINSQCINFSSFKEAKNLYAEQKYKKWINLISEYKLPESLKSILLQYDFSWRWIWENMTEEEIKNKFAERYSNFKLK